MRITTALFLIALPSPAFADKGAPVLLWKSNFNGAALADLQELSYTKDRSQLQTLLNSVDAEALILFLMNELNIEDFSGHPDALPQLQREFESSPNAFIPSMPPLQAEDLTSFSLVKVNINVPSSVCLVAGTSKTLLLVSLHDQPDVDRRTSLQQADITIGKVLNIVKHLTKSYWVVVTGKYSSMGGEIEKRPSRSLKTTNIGRSPVQQHLFLNFGCVLLYTSNSPVIHFQSMKETSGQQALLLALGAPSSNTSSCNVRDVNTVTISWRRANSTSISLDGVTLTLSFKARMTRPGGSDLSSWTLENVTLAYVINEDGKTNSRATAALDFDDVYAPRHFSYHCTNRLWAAEPTSNGTESDGPVLTALQLPGFQVQAFLAPGARVRFGRPWDCTTLFTIPILSGLFLSALLLLILAISLMMLANIPANDRFDDPYGDLLLAHLPTAE